jgi:HNH endonuclease
MRRKITVRKRLPVDTFIWNIFVEACGSRCSACGEENGKLERGHVIPYRLGSSESFDNLIPVCRRCNAKHKKLETPVTFRPADYLERFSILFLERLRPQLSSYTANGSCYLIPSSEHAENKHVICWRNAENGVQNSLITRSSDTLTRREAERIVESLVTAARRKLPLPIPYGPTKTSLVQLAVQHGRKKFDMAAEGFLAEDWSKPGMPDAVQHDCWPQFVDGFNLFLRSGEVHRANVERRKKKDAEEKLKQDEVNRESRAREAELVAKRVAASDVLKLYGQQLTGKPWRLNKAKLLPFAERYKDFRDALDKARTLTELQHVHDTVSQAYDAMQARLTDDPGEVA